MHLLSIDFQTLVRYFYLFTITANLIVLFIKLPYLKRYAIFIAIIGLSLTTELFKFFSPDSYNKQPINHSYILVELALFLIYYLQILVQPLHRKIIVAATIVALIIMLYFNFGPPGILYLEDFFDFVVAAFCICIFVAFFFRELINQKEFLQLTTYPDFWINTAHLLFYGGCLFVMGLHSYVLEFNPSLAKQLYHINHTLNIILYLMYLTAFLCLRKVK